MSASGEKRWNQIRRGTGEWDYWYCSTGSRQWIVAGGAPEGAVQSSQTPFPGADRPE
jgi:hypothetical protein